MATEVIEKPRINNGSGLGCGGSQVILYNDDHNAYDYVVGCVMSVFGHNEAMAKKITEEAHRKGRAIAEVEDEEPAKIHAAMLMTMGLKSEVETF